MSTIALSSIPDLTAAVSVPRLAAIEHPLGHLWGQPGDRTGQTEVLRSTLQAMRHPWLIPFLFLRDVPDVWQAELAPQRAGGPAR